MFVFAIAALFVFASCRGQGELEARTMSVFRINGQEVTITRGEGADTNPRIGQRISAGYNLTTGGESFCYIMLDRNSIVKMDEDSRIYIDRATDALLSLTVERGQILVDVSAQEPGHTLETRVGNVVLGVRGTLFVTGWAERGAVQIIMLEGEVETDTRRILRAGEITRIYEGAERTYITYAIVWEDLDDFARTAIINNINRVPPEIAASVQLEESEPEEDEPEEDEPEEGEPEEDEPDETPVISPRAFRAVEDFLVANWPIITSHGMRLVDLDAGDFRGAGDALWYIGARYNVWEPAGWFVVTGERFYDRFRNEIPIPPLVRPSDWTFVTAPTSFEMYHLDDSGMPVIFVYSPVGFSYEGSATGYNDVFAYRNGAYVHLGTVCCLRDGILKSPYGEKILVCRHEYCRSPGHYALVLMQDSIELIHAASPVNWDTWQIYHGPQWQENPTIFATGIPLTRLAPLTSFREEVSASALARWLAMTENVEAPPVEAPPPTEIGTFTFTHENGLNMTFTDVVRRAEYLVDPRHHHFEWEDAEYFSAHILYLNADNAQVVFNNLALLEDANLIRWSEGDSFWFDHYYLMFENGIHRKRRFFSDMVVPHDTAPPGTPFYYIDGNTMTINLSHFSSLLFEPLGTGAIGLRLCGDHSNYTNIFLVALVNE